MEPVIAELNDNVQQRRRRTTIGKVDFDFNKTTAKEYSNEIENVTLVKVSPLFFKPL